MGVLGLVAPFLIKLPARARGKTAADVPDAWALTPM